MSCYNESLLNNQINRKDFLENDDPFTGRLPLFDENNHRMVYNACLFIIIALGVLEILLKILYLIPWASFEFKFLVHRGGSIAQCVG